MKRIPPRALIIAADFGSIDTLRSLSENLAPCGSYVGYKIGFTLALKYGLPRLVKKLRATSEGPIIYDHQKAGTDIPQMGKDFADVLAESQVDAAILFPLAGPKTLESYVVALQENALLPIVGGHMTHPSFINSDGGYITNDAPLQIYDKAAEIGVKDIVVPGNQPHVAERYIRAFLDKQPDGGIWFPGIGRQGGDLPAILQFLHEKRAYPIVGSAVYQSENPRGVVETMLAQLCP